MPLPTTLPEPPWLPEARRLRAEGLGFREIAERLRPDGPCFTTIHYHLTGDASARRAQMRCYSARHARRPEQRGTCGRCGDQMGIGQDRDGTCSLCRTAISDERLEQVAQLMRDGLLMREIGERLGMSKSLVGTLVSRARKRGFDVPYRRHRGPS